MEIKFIYCDLCKGWAVICPRCGNNTCNGGSGEDGKCPVCNSCYELTEKIETKGIENSLDKIKRIFEENINLFAPIKILA